MMSGTSAEGPHSKKGPRAFLITPATRVGPDWEGRRETCFSWILSPHYNIHKFIEIDTWRKQHPVLEWLPKYCISNASNKTNSQAYLRNVFPALTSHPIKSRHITGKLDAQTLMSLDWTLIATAWRHPGNSPLLPQSAQESSSSGLFSRLDSFVPRQKLHMGMGSARGWGGCTAQGRDREQARERKDHNEQCGVLKVPHKHD